MTDSEVVTQIAVSLGWPDAFAIAALAFAVAWIVVTMVKN